MTEEIKPTSPSTLPLSTDSPPKKQHKQNEKQAPKQTEEDPPKERPKKGLFDEFA